MVPLGTDAATFSLPDVVTGDSVSLSDFAGAPLVVTFICNHCPFVVHVEKLIARLARDYRSLGVGWVAISANETIKRPQDGPDGMREQVQRAGFDFPYLFDDTQEVARAYGAVCTPDTFVFDADHKLVYRGQLDDARPRNDEPVDGHSVREILDALINGTPLPQHHKHSVGCGIKWRD